MAGRQFLNAVLSETPSQHLAQSPSPSSQPSQPAPAPAPNVIQLPTLPPEFNVIPKLSDPVTLGYFSESDAADLFHQSVV